MGKYLDIVRKFEARRQAEKQAGTLANQQQPSPDYRALYRQTAEAMAEDCLSLSPAWLLAHPEFYEQIKALDDRLTTMERLGASEPEYCSTLARLVKCIQDARAAHEQEREQASGAVQ